MVDDGHRVGVVGSLVMSGPSPTVSAEWFLMSGPALKWKKYKQKKVKNLSPTRVIEWPSFKLLDRVILHVHLTDMTCASPLFFWRDAQCPYTKAQRDWWEDFNVTYSMQQILCKAEGNRSRARAAIWSETKPLNIPYCSRTCPTVNTGEIMGCVVVQALGFTNFAPCFPVIYNKINICFSTATKQTGNRHAVIRPWYPTGVLDGGGVRVWFVNI